MYKNLQKIKKTNYFPEEFKNKQAIYKSYLFANSQEEDLEDDIVFLDKRTFTISNKKYEAYFYKSKPHANSKSYDKDWKLSYVAFQLKETIGVDYYHIETSQDIDETKPIHEVIDISVEKIKLKNRKRVNLVENNYLDY